MSIETQHLDLGCGRRPRNPYGCQQVHGIDISTHADLPQVRASNLALSPIPYPDGQFDSVSAYDFLEHIPRVLTTADGSSTRFPVIDLMNEVWRVLKPGGRFYASTPAYPAAEAFVDPTHVNLISERTHVYFTEPLLAAAMYGFHGRFRLLRSEWACPSASTPYVLPASRSRLVQVKRWIEKRRGLLTHLIWEFEAVKP